MEKNYYYDFENKFRGDRKKIFNIFSKYEPLIDKAIEGNVLPTLIDVGCGRGEWLQRCKNKFYKSIGIESDTCMVQVCRNHGLSVVEGDAIDELSKFENESISVITIFHMIEHLEYFKLEKLIRECQRILSNDGILIMETPSIDNLIVSTKTFHIDHTHVNPINPEAISFYLEKAGFSNVKYFYINGGPLQESYPLKITRILNGVAQDLCIISTKTQHKFDEIITKSVEWESHLNIGLSLFEAATEFDIKLESIIDSIQKSQIEVKANDEIKKSKMQQEISLLKKEILLLKSELKIFVYIFKIIRKLKNLIISFLKSFKNMLILLFYKILNLLLNFNFIRDFLGSKCFYFIARFILKILGNIPNMNVSFMINKINKMIDKKEKFLHYNQKLLYHYENSNKSKEYLKSLVKNRK